MIGTGTTGSGAGRNARDSEASGANVLYLGVLPLIHTDGLVEQVLTVFPSRDFATEFYPDEVEGYIDRFRNPANKYLTGGHVQGYEFEKEPTEDGRFVVRVTQRVA